MPGKCPRKYGKHECMLEEHTATFHSNTEKILSTNRFADMLLPWGWSAYSSCYYRSRASVNFERRRQIRSGYTYIIHPFSKFRFVWELIMIVNYWLAFIILPLEAAINPLHSLRLENLGNFEDILYFIHAIFSFDIMLNFVTGYCNPEFYTVVLEHKKIICKYLTTYFFFDFISTVPAIFHTILIYRYDWELKYVDNWSILTFLKIVRLRTLTNLHRLLAERLKIHETVYRVFTVLMIGMFALHWAAMLHLAMPFAHLYIRQSSAHAWFQFEDADFMSLEFSTIYLVCLFRAAGMLFANQKDRSNCPWDYVLTHLFNLLGLLYLGFLFLQVRNIMPQRYKSEVQYDEFMKHLRAYMKQKHLPINIQKTLLTFYEFRYRHIYFDERNIRSTLCSRFKQEIAHFDCELMLKALNLYDELSETDIQDIANNLHHQVFLPKEYIIQSGATGDTLYFMVYGTAAIYTPSGKEVCHLHEGSYFGETALIMKDKKRTATVIAVEVCVVNTLNRRLFNKRFMTNEKIYSILFNTSQQRIKETKAVEALHNKSFDIVEHDIILEMHDVMSKIHLDETPGSIHSFNR